MLYNKNIRVIPFPDIADAYVVISAAEDERKSSGVRKCMSFLVDGKNGKAVEWEPEYGSITRLTQCAEGDEGAQEHWFYPFYKGQGDWSQLGVERSHLPELLLEGNYVAMFNAMRAWL